MYSNVYCVYRSKVKRKKFIKKGISEIGLTRDLSSTRVFPQFILYNITLSDLG